jgi:hypothetical protein
MRIRSKSFVVAAFTIAIGAAIAGVAVGAGGDGSAKVSYTPNHGHRPPVLPASSTPDQVVSAVLARAHAPTVVTAKLESPPAVPGIRAGQYLHFVVAIPADDERDMRAKWEADVIAGALADTFADRGASPIVGTVIDGKLPDGTIVPAIGSGFGDIVNGQDFSNSDPSHLKAAVAQALSGVGLRPITVDVLSADQAAPAVVAETSDPVTAATNAAETIRAVFGTNPPNYEGFYLEVRDQAGKPVFIESAAYRSGVGRQWFSPQVKDIISVQHGSAPAGP